MNTVEKIVDLIEKKEVQYKEFAKELGLTTNIVSEWKNGKTSSYKEHIVKIADYFGVTTDYLLRDGEQKNNFTLIKTEENNMLESDKMFKIFADNFYNKEYLCKTFRYIETCIKRVLESKTFSSDIANKKITGFLKLWNKYSETWMLAEILEEEFFNNRLQTIEQFFSFYSKLIKYIPADLNSFATRELLQMSADDKKNIDDIKKEIEDLIQEWDYHHSETIETKNNFEEDIVELRK